MIEKAEEFATLAHKGQKRKGGKDIPYITHPLAVAEILKSVKSPPETIIGGILHDVVEDTDTTLKHIGERFGKHVMNIVDYVTEKDTTFPIKGIERTKSWKSRKVAYIHRIKDAPIEAVWVAAADKLHNLRDTLRDFEKHGDGVFDIALSVDCDETAYKSCLSRGAQGFGQQVWVEDDDGKYERIFL